MTLPRLAALTLALATVAGCTTKTPPPAGPPGKVRLIEGAHAGDLAAAVTEQLRKSSQAERTLLVYVGATWCEPCRHFHDAAEKGLLDAAFPRLDVLAFDTDLDAERLEIAAYRSNLIPLFAVPGPDGRASGRQIEGSIKGDGAIADLTPRLQQLLAPAH